MYTALISGGTGFIGSRIVAALLADGAEVRVLTSSPEGRLRVKNCVDGIQWFGLDDADLDLATHGINCFFHFAVAYDRPSISDDVLEKVNIYLPLRIIERLTKQNQVIPCVLGDTFFCKFAISATRQPRYTRSKVKFAELLSTRESDFRDNVRIALLQIEQVYGSGDAFTKVLPMLARQMLENVPRLSTTHGQQKRDFIHVNDVAAAAMTVSKAEWYGVQRVECGSGASIPVRDVFKRLHALTRSSSVIGFGDIPPDQSIDDSFADIGWLSKHGWQPRMSLDQGLVELVRDVADRMSGF